MDLTLLVLSDGKILLYPTDRCGIRRRADGKIRNYNLDDTDLSAQLGYPDPQSTYHNFHTMFLSRFTQSVIISSTKLLEDLVFFFVKVKY
ncbi:hypothetical protein [Ehrlichia canis]|uniref:Uncharacterized protein n=1 Tax=Ehrlichia canis (strain Jake) TaxID=269484 RepID=A0ACA6AW08_EHRCJ|nr:hypothetical protein [Ehrlichia canis]AAZ68520.1 hypothetical protein Ecaj_0483 [Ehrlichia canis str. Jake]